MDGNTPYVSGGNIFSVFKFLEEIADADKCHALLSASNDLTAKISEVQIKNTQSDKLTGITIEDHAERYAEKQVLNHSLVTAL